jgi:probable biosynthetic protein (TIGR04098 family)
VTETAGEYRYELVLGLPHTNHRGLAEHLALAHLGHLYWTSIARAIGRPLSSLRSPAGEEVYATFYFVETTFPEEAPIDGFRLDDRLDVTLRLRAFKGMAVEGDVTFDHAPPRGGGRGVPIPRVRFASIFITPSAGNSALRVVAPVDADFSGLPPLPLAENPHHITKAAEERGTLGLLGPEWEPVVGGTLDQRREIDPDRDSNGAGLVYFANYVVFMNGAERAAMREAGLTESEILTRVVRTRRIAYYGNAGLSGDLVTRVVLLRSSRRARELGFRYAIHRAEDGALICLSEAVKILRH